MVDSSMSRRGVLATGLAAAGLAACTGPLYRYRYRLTMEVLVDGVAHRGVNVAQCEARVTQKQYGWPTETGYSRTRGEANVVDLGARGLLIALLTRRDEITPKRAPDGWTQDGPLTPLAKLYGVTNFGFQDDGTDAGMAAIVAKGGERPIGPEFLPTLVTFGDRSDPKSVKQVNPFDLQATFEGSVAFGRLTLGIVDAPLTRGIEKVLPWLVGMTTMLSGKDITSDNELSSNLAPSDFRRN